MHQHHYLTPVAVFASLMLAFVIDYFSFGKDEWRDKVAFVFYLPGIAEGFNGGKVDQLLLQLLGRAVDLVKHAGNTYLADAETNLVVGIVVAGVELFAIGCLLPVQMTKWEWSSKWVGKWATWKFPKSSAGRIGWRLIALAVFVGLLYDNVGGAIGQVVTAGIKGNCAVVGPVLNFLFVWRNPL